ncbi:MAG: M14 family metallocarboxypeptidase [Bacteroidota bacterium]
MKSTFTFLALLLIPMCAWAQFNPQQEKLTAKFFPDAELDIHTPAFAKKEGFTNYDEMLAWLNTCIKPHSSVVTLSFIGSSQKGKQIPMLVFNRQNGKTKTKVWMQGGLHGDEPAGTETMLYLTDKLLNDTAYAYLLTELEIAIVPMANIDGYEKQTRESANGTDLNRDQTKLSAPESKALKAAYTNFTPAVALDFHEFRPFRKDFTGFGTRGISSFYDAMFLYSGNLNVPEALRSYTQTRFVNNAKAHLTENNLNHHDYITPRKAGGLVEFNLGSVHARSSASNWSLGNTVSTLLEIRGVGIGRTSFKRRIKTSFLIAESYLKSAYAERVKLRELLKETGSSFTESIVVTAESNKEKQVIKAIDLEKNEAVDLEITIRNALHAKPILKRIRPTAYILSADEKKASANLRILGIQLDSLEKDTELETEAYTITEFDAEENEDEEASGPKSSASTVVQKQVFTKGTYIIYTAQPRGNLVSEVLEPENEDGFLAMKVIKGTAGKKLPVYRYMKPGKINK